MSEINELIAKLALRPRGLEMVHPDCNDAYQKLKQMGSEAVEPLIQALSAASPFTQSWIISILGNSQDARAIAPICGQLSASNTDVRFEAVSALAKYSNSVLQAALIEADLQRAATTDPNVNVRNAALALFRRLGYTIVAPPWYTGASGWEQLAIAFIRTEAKKPNPDYKELAHRLESVSGPERHGAWARVAGEVKNYAAARCYLEALHNDPDPNSVAWGWLNGERGKGSQECAPVLKPTDPLSRATVESAWSKFGTIVEEGGSAPLVIELQADSVDEARQLAAQRLGKDLKLAQEEVLRAQAGQPTTVEGEGETPDAALAELKKKVPFGASILGENVSRMPSHRLLTAEAPVGAKPDFISQLRADEYLHADGKLIELGSRGFLGIGRKPTLYQKQASTKACVSLTYIEKVCVRYTVYRRSLPENGSAE